MRGEHRGGRRAAARVVERRAVRPFLRERHLSPEPSTPARRASWVGPSWCRHCHVSVHAFGRFSQRFRRPVISSSRPFGERRLAAAVAADDDRQARARLERQRRGRADPAEALDGDRRQPDRRRRVRGRGATRLAGDLDHPLGLGVELPRLQALEQQGAQDGIHARTGSRSGVRWRRSSCRRRAQRGDVAVGGRARARTATAASAARPRTRSPPPRCRAAGRDRLVDRVRRQKSACWPCGA